MKTHSLAATAVLLSLINVGVLAAPPSQADAEPPRPCMQTGSRLPSKGGCVNAAGHVITREELQATGAMTMGDALRHTVPSATIR